MARIRTIKPEFWGDEKLAPLAPIDRLVFLGLISMADDAGRLVDNIKAIDGFLFPESDDSSRDSLDILARLSRVFRYESDSGQGIIQVANWLKHQKVDRPSRYVLPPPRENVASISRDTRAPILDLGPTTLDLRPWTDDLGPVKPEQPATTAGEFLDWLPPEKRPAWRKELATMGMAYSPEDIDRACQDAMLNGGNLNAAYFRGMVAAAKERRLHPPLAKQAVAVGNGNGIGAAGTFAAIRALVREHQQPGQQIHRFIPKAEVAAMGPAVLAAYEGVGGAERFLAATGEQMGFLLRDFTKALEASHV